MELENEQRQIAVENNNPVGTFFKNLFMVCGTGNDDDKRPEGNGGGCCVGQRPASPRLSDMTLVKGRLVHKSEVEKNGDRQRDRNKSPPARIPEAKKNRYDSSDDSSSGSSSSYSSSSSSSVDTRRKNRRQNPLLLAKASPIKKETGAKKKAPSLPATKKRNRSCSSDSSLGQFADIEAEIQKEKKGETIIIGHYFKEGKGKINL